MAGRINDIPKKRGYLAIAAVLLLFCFWYTRPMTLGDILRQEDIVLVDATLMDWYTYEQHGTTYGDYHVSDLDAKVGSPGLTAMLETLGSIPCRRSLLGILYSNGPILHSGAGNVNITLATDSRRVDLIMQEGESFLYTSGNRQQTYKLADSAYGTLRAVIRRHGILREE